MFVDSFYLVFNFRLFIDEACTSGLSHNGAEFSLFILKFSRLFIQNIYFDEGAADIDFALQPLDLKIIKSPTDLMVVVKIQMILCYLTVLERF